MQPPTTLAAALAAGSTGVYFVGLACLKTGARRLPRLRATRPLRLLGAMSGSRRCRYGIGILITGIGLQYAAFTRLTLVQAQPALLSGLVAAVLIATVVLGEPVEGREWLCLALVAAAAALVLYRSTWPQTPAHAGLLVGGVVLSLAAVALVPRHDHTYFPAHHTPGPDERRTRRASRRRFSPARSHFSA